MDRDKIEELRLLCIEKLSGFTAAVLHTEGGKIVHCEITLSFRKNEEVDSAISKLQQLHIR